MNKRIIHISYLLFSLANCEKIIKNIDIPSCRNCIHFKPMYYNDFLSPLNRCTNLGEKNIITDEIEYDFADTCRKNEEKCGNKGKYFEEEKNIELKILKHSIIRNIPIGITLSLIFFPFGHLFFQ
jgi:hypothetical protein